MKRPPRLVRDGRQVISSVISSQIPLHAMYGGVVPEIASRAHVESVDPVVDEALKKAGMTLADVDAVAVTYGPGLVGRAAYRRFGGQGAGVCGRISR